MEKKTLATILVVAVVCVGFVLALGLGLGLPRSTSSHHSKPDPERPKPKGCRIYVPHTTAPRLTPNISCPVPGQTAKCPTGVERPVLIVLSMDGFRAEYLQRNLTPTLKALSDCGIRASYLKSVFPSKTFPNHYSMVTGLYAESHNLVDNHFYDPDFGEIYNRDGRNLSDNRWYSGEPIWNTAKKAGKKVATMMWVGSSINIQGIRPDICYNYNYSVTLDDRVAEVLTWFDGDPQDFPSLGVLYFEEPDTVGHRVGPVHAEMDEMLENVDSLVATLIEGLKRRLHDCFNIVIISDHGMSAVKIPENVIVLSDYINISRYTTDGGAYGRMSGKFRINSYTNVSLINNPVPISETLSRLACKSEYMLAMRKDELPKRYHYCNSRRIVDIIIDVTDEYCIFDNKPAGEPVTVGFHGYDNAYSNMHAIFIAYGPSFKQNVVVDGFENVELYNLFADLLAVRPAVNNGTEGSLRHLMLSPPPLSPRSNGSDYLVGRYPADDDQYEARVNSTITPCLQLFSRRQMRSFDDQLNFTESQQKALEDEHLTHGLPIYYRRTGPPAILLHHKYFVSAYSPELKQPVWTAAQVSAEKVQTASTSVICSRFDVRVTADQPTCCDNKTSSNKTVVETFLFPPRWSRDVNGSSDTVELWTNMVLMSPNFKNGVWEYMLEYIRNISAKLVNQKLYVMFGPVFDYDSDGRADTDLTKARMAAMRDDIPLATHYFVVVLKCSTPVRCSRHDYDSLAFVLPQRQAPESASCTTAERVLRLNSARIRDVELLTGLQFLRSHPSAQAATRIRVSDSDMLW